MMNYLFWGIALLFFWKTISTLYHLQWANRLPPLASFVKTPPPSLATFRCSIVIPARDEEARIENTVRNLLRQQQVDVEIIAVDDRSTDRTHEILQNLARENQRVKVIQIKTLPEGWLGKCHACHVGAKEAAGDWILFTDADCWLAADVIQRALLAADRDLADHITLTPGIVPESAGGEAWHVGFLYSLADWISRVNRDKPRAYLGMGAFNLVRRDAYLESGGYEALRLTVVDDIKLGLLLQRAGKRTRGFIGGEDAKCFWGTTALSMIKIMEKNYFAAVDYRTGVAVVLVIGGSLVWVTALLGVFSGTLAGLAATLGLFSITIPAAVLVRRLGWGIRGALLTPFIFPLLFYAVFNSTWKTLRQGGIRWRDTFYSLKMLREGNVK